MSGECDRCSEHALDCKCIHVGFTIGEILETIRGLFLAYAHYGTINEKVFQRLHDAIEKKNPLEYRNTSQTTERHVCKKLKF